MAVLIRRQRWAQQPNHPVVADQSHPSFKGLRVAITPPAGPRDAVTGRPLGVGSSVVIERKKFGEGPHNGHAWWCPDSSNSGIQLPDNTITTAGSALLIFKCADTASNYCFELGAGGNNDHFPYSGAAYIDAFLSGSGARWINNVGALSGSSFDAPIALLLRVKDGTQTALWNGALWASNTIVYGSYPFNYPTGGLAYVGRSGDAAHGLNGHLFAAFVWDRYLSDAEAVENSRAPYALVGRRNLRPVYFVGAAGGDIVIAATVGGATASGIAAAVTQGITVAATVGSATATGIAAAVTQAITVNATVGAATGSGIAATVTQAITVGATVGSAAASGIAASIELGEAISATVGTATASGIACSVSQGITIAATVGAAVASGIAATISVTPDRYARPVSDVDAGTWTPSSGGDLYAMLDEESAEDSDYVVAAAPGYFEVLLNEVADPGSNGGHKLSIRVPAGFTPSGALTVSVRQGASTEIAAWNEPSPAAGTTYGYELSEAQAGNITNYADLRVRVAVA